MAENSSISNSILLNQPFDLSLTPENLLTDDAPDQASALQAVLYTPQSDSDDNNRFFTQQPITKSLSYLRRLYENNNPQAALDLLSKRTNISFRSPSFTTPADDNSLSWRSSHHYLDMMVCVGNGLGLGAILPNQNINSMFEIRLDFSHPQKRFKAKYAQLGFNPYASMLWIGRSPSSEDIWIAWIPHHNDHNDSDSNNTNTSLSTKHYRITIMLFASLLSAIGYRDIIIHNPYPPLDSQDDFLQATNLLYVHLLSPLLFISFIIYIQKMVTIYMVKP